MAIAPQPSILNMAWASSPSADKNAIPDTMQVADMSNDAAASWSMGFPSQTSLSQGQGGYYVSRQDVNGALNRLSEFAMFAQSGAIYNWSASVDYGTGAHVRGSDGVEYIALVDNGPDVSSAVNPTTDVNYTTWEPYLRNIADFIYPIGSIYMSVSNTSPAVLFGGTWAKISGRFLLGSGGSYNVGDTGGAATKQLSVSEMPQHTHGASTANAGSHNHTATNANNGAHTHSISITNGAQSAGAHTHGVTYAATTVAATAASAGAHTHTVSVAKQTITSTASGNHTHLRGTMNVTGKFSGVGEKYSSVPNTVTGAFYVVNTAKNPSQGVPLSNSGDKDDYFGFDASRSWSGHTSVPYDINGGTKTETHTHSITIAAASLTTSNAGAHTHSVSVAIPKKDMTTGSAGAHTHNISGTSASAGSHTHTITVDTSGVHSHTVTVNNAGGNTAFSIMPPYLVVNIWQRTA